MAAQLYINNFATTVAATFGVTDTFLQIASNAGLPALSAGNWFYLTLFRLSGVIESGHEVVKVTAWVGNQLTVVRTVEGAAASQFVIGDKIQARVTAGSLNALETKAVVATLQTLVDTKDSAVSVDAKVAGLASSVTSALATKQTAIDAKANSASPTITGTASVVNLVTSGKTTLAGSPSTLALELVNVLEDISLVAAAASGTINMDVTSQSLLYYTVNATANWAINIRGNATTALNSLQSVGTTLTVSMWAKQGATPYMPTSFQIDGTTFTPQWLGGVAPTTGNASSIDLYTFTIIKTANATFTVIASQGTAK